MIVYHFLSVIWQSFIIPVATNEETDHLKWDDLPKFLWGQVVSEWSGICTMVYWTYKSMVGTLDQTNT